MSSLNMALLSIRMTFAHMAVSIKLGPFVSESFLLGALLFGAFSLFMFETR